MKISEQWLRELVPHTLNVNDLSHQLTMAGLEVDAIEPVAGAFENVVVGEIIDAQPHPDADKLRVCKVTVGSGESLQIVCGAPNARVGLKAPVALVGAVLPGDFSIKASKLRGVESEGMLCAEAELGLSESSDGLMELATDAPIGESLRRYLSLEDHSIEIGLTPNRADCLSALGIAREISVLTGVTQSDMPALSVTENSDAAIRVLVTAGSQCAVYAARVVEGLDNTGPTPVWMTERLRRSGIRCKDPLVDVTNYVMLELGQPMHAFDADKVVGAITVRTAGASESMTLLDGKLINLPEGALLITDEEGPIAFAGVMGGQRTAISATTTAVILESAFFAPHALAGQARKLGMHTDASHRFERGVDFALAERALDRATGLLISLTGGQAGPMSVVRHDDQLPSRDPVKLNARALQRALGVAIESKEVDHILNGLGLDTQATPEGWICSVPSWRFDIAIEADLIEEVARIYGYNKLPVSQIYAALDMPIKPETTTPASRIRRYLAARDLREVITYSFIEPKLAEAFGDMASAVVLRNPISEDLSVMRSSLVPGLVAVAHTNSSRQQSRVRIFELGLAFEGTDGYLQTPKVALLIGGRAEPERVGNRSATVDFFDLKGEVEALLRHFGIHEVSYASAEVKGFHPGQTASISVGGAIVGHLGQVHPSVQKALGLSQPVFAAEMNRSVLSCGSVPSFTPVSKYPEVRRDVAVVVDQNLPVATLVECAKDALGALHKEAFVFDVYTGQGVSEGLKSVAIGLTLADQSRTLSESDVSEAMAQVIESLKKTCNAELR